MHSRLKPIAPMSCITRASRPARWSTVNNRLNRLPAAFILLPMTMKRVVFVSLVLMFSASTERPYSAAVSSEAMAATLLSPASATLFAAAAVFWKACVSSPRLRMNFADCCSACGWDTAFFTSDKCAPGTPSRFWLTGRSYTSHTQISLWA